MIVNLTAEAKADLEQIGTRLGDNGNLFEGGFRLWQKSAAKHRGREALPRIANHALAGVRARDVGELAFEGRRD